MAAFNQNPVMDGPGYSFADVPVSARGDFREHRFNPYDFLTVLLSGKALGGNQAS